MHKKYLFLFLFFIFSTIHIFAISKEKGWNRGVIVLHSGEIIQGDLCYDQHLEVVQCQSEGITKAYTALQVKYFRYQDQHMGIERKFIPVAFSPTSDYKHDAFFEVVTDGPITLLRKHSRWKHLTANPGFMRVNPELGFSNQVIGFEYYVQQSEGLRKVKKFRKEFFPAIMREYGEKVNQFVRKNQLKLFMMASQIIVVQYYNYLKDPLKNKWESDNLATIQK
jgi:hypothetical protein